MVSQSELFFRHIDYPLLRAQKRVLLQVIDIAETGGDFEDFNAEPYLIGLLHLIDAIQDHAVDVLDVPESDVLMLDEVDE